MFCYGSHGVRRLAGGWVGVGGRQGRGRVAGRLGDGGGGGRQGRGKRVGRGVGGL